LLLGFGRTFVCFQVNREGTKSDPTAAEIQLQLQLQLQLQPQPQPNPRGSTTS
jgi:hypothetical protein